MPQFAKLLRFYSRFHDDKSKCNIMFNKYCIIYIKMLSLYLIKLDYIITKQIRSMVYAEM